MALQRLVDLNRMIKSAEFVLQTTDLKFQSQVLDGADQSVHHKKCRKWEKRISKLKKEAAGLTEFIMRYLTVLADGPSFSTYSDTGFNSLSPHKSDKWDTGFSTVNRRSFPTAVWWIICQNIDVWCSHATKKKLKMFLSFLVQSSLSSTAESPAYVNHKNARQPPVVTVQQISFELLHDSTLYEHRFVHRQLASSFCKMLEKSAVTLLPNSSSTDFDFSVSPNWSELLEALEKSLEVSKRKRFGHVRKPVSSFQSSIDNPNVGVFHVTSRKYAICQNLLGFLCWMPKSYLDSRSLKLYVTHVLNIERLAVSRMLNYQGHSKSCDYYELFKLFCCCRKAVKHLVAASCDENTGAGLFSSSPIFSEGSFPFLWLLKSAYLVLGLQDSQANDDPHLYADTTFSLMDHTSYIFLVSTKYYFAWGHDRLLDAKVSSTENDSDEGDANCNSIQLDSYADSSKYGEAWESMFVIAQSVKKDTQGLLGSLEESPDSKMVNFGGKHSYLSKLAYLASCLSGCFWGLASALSHIDAKDGGNEVALLKRKKDFVSKLSTFMDIYAEVVRFQFRILLDQSDKLVNYSGDLSGFKEFSLSDYTSRTDLYEHWRPVKGVVRTFLESPGFIYDSSIANVNSNSKMDGGGFFPGVSAEVPSFDLQILNKHYLQRILNGDEHEAAFLLRHILLGYSALLRLNLQVGADCLSPNVLHVLMAVVQFLISDLSNSVEVPEPFIFVSLDGVLKLLEELGSHFPLTDPTLSRIVYSRLVELHLMAIGKCISLQGKKYTLISHEMESNTKILQSHMVSCESSYSHSSFCLDEFIARLRMSFEVFIRKSSELHLLSGVQAVERALVGIQVGCTATYDINTGKAGGGRVSSYVAAGIDCLDLLLENVTGRKRLSVVRRHIQSLIASLFNIILHLQGPLIFYERSIENFGDNDPDSGAVVLMCIEVLTRISGKHALFQMDSWHVAQSLRIPAALFQEFSQLRLHKAPVASGSISSMENLDCNLKASVDHRFSVDMYDACCRLLYTVLKHHKSESEKCIAQLQDSVSILLHALETRDTDSVSTKNCFSWEVQEGITCACSLRRIYEEMRQQKDVFGPHCFKLLANYIWVYSGFGTLNSGIRREIDEALRPGIYALIDACSADDLQYLHTVFGEGPCRSALARLQHDYTSNFQYEGKV
ncbi:hypothetical protein CRG98_000948 [Punica granatum]|nr:hypothetical protein CRG98_000948 [Punica granatum]